jgi:hypothetical protein
MSTSTIEWMRWGDCASAVTCRVHGRPNMRSLRLDRTSGGSGGAAVWLDAVLAEQVAQPLELEVQSLVQVGGLTPTSRRPDTRRPHLGPDARRRPMTRLPPRADVARPTRSSPASTHTARQNHTNRHAKNSPQQPQTNLGREANCYAETLTNRWQGKDALTSGPPQIKPCKLLEPWNDGGMRAAYRKFLASMSDVSTRGFPLGSCATCSP